MTTSKFPGWSRDMRKEMAQRLRDRIACIGEPRVSYEDMHRAYQDAVVGAKPFTVPLRYGPVATPWSPIKTSGA